VRFAFFRNVSVPDALIPQETKENVMLKGVVLWAMGVPIIVIVLLYAFIF
jgi:hypothetical protein